MLLFYLKPKQYGMDFGYSSTPFGPPSRPPKDVFLPPAVPLRPPKPPPYNVNHNEEPPIVPPRRRNSPALITTQLGQQGDQALARPPVRPSSRAANGHVESSLLGRPASQAVPISRASQSHAASKDDDDITPTGSPVETKSVLVPAGDREAQQKQHLPVRMIFVLLVFGNGLFLCSALFCLNFSCLVFFERNSSLSTFIFA